MRRYFVTGGTGFIGREIVRQLLEREDTEHVMCLTRGHRTNLIEDRRVVYWKGDIVDCEFPYKNEWTFKDLPFTDLIHGANEVNDLLQPDQLKYYYTIVEGTNRALKWAATTGIERTLVLSSGAVARETIYGRAKRQCEMIANYFMDDSVDQQYKIARIFSVIGPEMPLNGQYAAGRFVGMALAEKRVRYYGGESVRTYLDVTDCAASLLRILDDDLGLKPVDVAGEEPISIADLAHLVAKVFDVPCVKIEGPERVDNYLPDSSSPQTLTLTESLERIREHYKAVSAIRGADMEPPARG